MEVKRAGITPRTWRREVKCPRCESDLEISWKDISIQVTRKQTLFSNKRVASYIIKCQECGCRIELDESKIPNIIKKEVYNNMDMVDRLLNFYFS